MVRTRFSLYARTYVRQVEPPPATGGGVPPAAAYLAEVARQGRTTTYGEAARAIGTGPRVAPKVCLVIRDLCLGPWLPAETDAAAKAALIRAMQAAACAFDWAPLLAYYGVH